MSGHQYVANPDNLFEDDNDVDDETFLRNSRNGGPTNGVSTNPFEESVQVYEEKRKQIENRTLQSSERSLGLLYETEEVGKATAIELAKQREQLEKSTRQLDEINATLRFSQKHLNGLKSVFGGLKNYLSGNRDMSPRVVASPSDGKLSDEISPTTSAPLSPDERYNSHPVSRLRNDSPTQQQQQTQEKANNFDKKLEQNLENMCGGLSRLKDLAIDLRGEIDSQNELLDNMNYKMEDVDIKMGKQQKQINKLLK